MYLLFLFVQRKLNAQKTKKLLFILQVEDCICKNKYTTPGYLKSYEKEKERST